MDLLCKNYAYLVRILSLKVSKNRIEFMRSSFFSQNSNENFVRISTLASKKRSNPKNDDLIKSFRLLLAFRCGLSDVGPSRIQSTKVLTNYRVCQYGLWGFQPGRTKLERFLHKNHHTLRKLLNFEF